MTSEERSRATAPKKDRLDKALDRLYESMKNGDRKRQEEGTPLIWGPTNWFEVEEI